MKNLFFFLLFALVVGGCAEKAPPMLKKINAHLDHIEHLPVPRLNNEVIVCYFPPPAPDHVNYICPACGEKTILTHNLPDVRDEKIIWLGDLCFYPRALTASRALMKEIQELGLDAKLDERAFCASCQTDANLDPLSFYLVVKLNGKTTRTKLYTPCGYDVPHNELVILKTFLKGEQLIWHAAGWGEQSLKSEIPLIRELLGLDNPLVDQKYKESPFMSMRRQKLSDIKVERCTPRSDFRVPDDIVIELPLDKTLHIAWDKEVPDDIVIELPPDL